MVPVQARNNNKQKSGESLVNNTITVVVVTEGGQWAVRVSDQHHARDESRGEAPGHPASHPHPGRGQRLCGGGRDHEPHLPRQGKYQPSEPL